MTAEDVAGAADPGPGSPTKQAPLRKITLAGGVALIVGSIVGAGIFVSPSGMFQETESVGFSLVMWMLAGRCTCLQSSVVGVRAANIAPPTGVFSCLGALCYAELGTVVNRSGGEYAYLTAALGPLCGFLQLWTSLLILQPTPLAVMARTFAAYAAKPFFADCEAPEVVIKLLAVVGLGADALLRVHGVGLGLFPRCLFCLCACRAADGGEQRVGAPRHARAERLHLGQDPRPHPLRRPGRRLGCHR